MKKQNFAICDMETSYAYNLMEYLSERKNVPFEVLIFSEIASLALFAGESGLDLLLISSRMMCSDVKKMDIGKIIILSEGELPREFSDYPAIYKYQSSESLVAEMMDFYARQSMPQTALLLKRDVRIYGVYSPVGRCGKTGFALTLGQILAEKKSVIYINMEDYAGFETLMGKEFHSDIADMIYFIRQRKGGVVFKLNAVIQRLGNMDYVPPAFSFADLREVSTEEWLSLLEEITTAGGYEVVILDIGSAAGEHFSLLSACTRIYTPICGDVLAKAKLAQYEKNLCEMDYGDILNKTVRLHLPFVEFASEGEYILEQLAWGPMGHFVRDMLEGGRSGEGIVSAAPCKLPQ